MAVKAPANGRLLRWAREDLGLSVPEAAQALSVKPDAVSAWEAGDREPTINQVRKAAALYQQTPAFFLMSGEAPRHSAHRPTDFRRHPAGDDSLGPALAREIGRARNRRERMLALVGDTRHGLPAIADAMREPEQAAAAFRLAVGVPLSRQFGFRTPALALQEWLNVLDDLGVLVFQMSRVDPDTCRGFSIYEDELPVIVLNGAESAPARIFTLWHEVAHLLSRTGGLCDVWRNSGVERRCNEFASALLMPRSEFIAEADPDDALANLKELADRFSVSQSAVAVRLRNLGLISQEQLDDQLATARDMARAAREEARQRQRGGPAPHILKLRNLSPRYVTTVLDALERDVINLVDAAHYLESKVATVDKMQAELARRSGTSA